MAEWIATATTGLVGLVGVTALLWTARQERAALLANLRRAAEVERHRVDLIEKRRIYASYFAQAESTRHAVVAVRGFLDPTAEPAAESVTRAADLVGRMFAAYYELALVAPLPVRSLAGKLFEEIRDDYAQARLGGLRTQEDVALRGQLLDAMRDDLEDHDPLVTLRPPRSRASQTPEVLPPDAPPNGEPRRDLAARSETDDEA